MTFPINPVEGGIEPYSGRLTLEFEDTPANRELVRQVMIASLGGKPLLIIIGEEEPT